MMPERQPSTPKTVYTPKQQPKQPKATWHRPIITFIPLQTTALTKGSFSDGGDSTNTV